MVATGCRGKIDWKGRGGLPELASTCAYAKLERVERATQVCNVQVTSFHLFDNSCRQTRGDGGLLQKRGHISTKPSSASRILNGRIERFGLPVACVELGKPRPANLGQSVNKSRHVCLQTESTTWPDTRVVAAGGPGRSLS